MLNQEILNELIWELYSQITKDIKEKGLTEEVLKAIDTLTTLFNYC